MRVTQDEIKQAEQIPLIDFINANGIDLEKAGKGYRLVEHDSLVITGNKFYWNSRSVGGYGSIKFAMEYYDLKFPQAVKRVNAHEYKELTDVDELVKSKPFKYPKYHEVSDTKAIKNYLVNERGIDERVVDWCIKKDLLVQDKMKNAVFKWKNDKGEVVGGDRQGTVKIDTKRGTFKNIIESSQEDGGFTINVGKNPNKLAIFESPIDMLSYWSIKQSDLQNIQLRSMSGLKYQSVKRAFLDMKKNGVPPKEIISCVDNDEAGINFNKKIKPIFTNPYCKFVIDSPKHAKDWNDELKLIRNKSKSINKQNNQQEAVL